jgi:hypothetical protein
MGGRGRGLRPDRLAGVGLLLRFLLLLLLSLFCPLARRSGSCGIADGFLGLALWVCCCCPEGDAALIQLDVRWKTCMTQIEAQNSGCMGALGIALHPTTSDQWWRPPGGDVFLCKHLHAALTANAAFVGRQVHANTLQRCVACKAYLGELWLTS